MSTVSVILNSTNTNSEVKQKSFTDINPNATNAQLKAFTQGMNSLTNNTYDSTYRVERTHVDTAADKTQATITLATESIDLATVTGYLKGNYRIYDIASVTYNGDGQLYAFVSSDTAGFLGVSVYVGASGSAAFRLFSGSDNFVNQIVAPITITIRADETTNYTAAEATFTITA